MGKTAFVTGGTGFVGSHLVDELLRRDYHEVRCVVRTKRKWLAGLPITEVRGSLGDSKLIQEALEGVDYVYHVAGVTRGRTADVLKKGNVDATLFLLEAVKRVVPGVQKVVVTSSLAAVGRGDRAVVDETAELCPLTRYGHSKAEMEVALRREDESGLSLLEVLPVVVIRPPVVYGPRDRDMFAFFRTARTGVCPFVGRRDEQYFSLVNVHDLVRGMVDAAESAATAGQTYFIGSNEGVSWGQLLRATEGALGRRVTAVPIPRAFVGPLAAVVEGVGRIAGYYPPLNREKAREILHAAKICSCRRARRHFGYRSQITLEDGVRDTVAWYRSQGWLR